MDDKSTAVPDGVSYTSFLDLDGSSITDWPVNLQEALQTVRDALQPEHDFIFERGRWSLVRMDYLYSYAHQRCQF